VLPSVKNVVVIIITCIIIIIIIIVYVLIVIVPVVVVSKTDKFSRITQNRHFIEDFFFNSKYKNQKY
jgi:hypothetical protein